jgi:hypothetical protein
MKSSKNLETRQMWAGIRRVYESGEYDNKTLAENLPELLPQFRHLPYPTDRTIANRASIGKWDNQLIPQAIEEQRKKNVVEELAALEFDDKKVAGLMISGLGSQDLETRRRYIDMYFNLRGVYAPKKIENKDTTRRAVNDKTTDELTSDLTQIMQALQINVNIKTGGS